MRKQKIKQALKRGVCSAMAVFAIGAAFTLGAFAQTESYNGVSIDQSQVPFLTIDFNMQQDWTNYGLYRVKVEQYNVDQEDIVLAEGYSYKLVLDGDVQGTFFPSETAPLILQWRTIGRTKLAETTSTITWKYTRSIRLSCSEGTLVREDGFGNTSSEPYSFALEWGVGYATVFEDKETHFKTLAEVEPYRDQYAFIDGYLYQQAPLGGFSLRNLTTNTSANVRATDLQFQFFLPSDDSTHYTSDLSFTFGFLRDLVTFNSILLQGSYFENFDARAWSFQYITPILQQAYWTYYYQGYEGGAIAGYDEGFEVGRQLGYNEGRANPVQGNVGDLVTSVLDSEYKIFRNFLNYDIQIGDVIFNPVAWMGFLVVLLIIVVIVRKVWF